MKQAGYTKRPYGRSAERPRPSQTKQSNGSSVEGKMRGNPQQCVEKYLTLARDATSLGDPISAENYYQYADHYYRLVIASRPPRSSSPIRKSAEAESEVETQSQPEFVQEESAPAPVQRENWLD